MKVTLLIPTLNEEKGCEKILPLIDKDWVDEIIIIDGQSKDQTVKVCKDMGFKVLIQKEKGLNASFREAWPYINGDIVITFSPDGNSLAEKIPPLINKMREGFDMVIVSRYLEEAKSYEKLAKDHDSPFTWSEGESLSDMEKPERVKKIKEDYEIRKARWKANKAKRDLLAWAKEDRHYQQEDEVDEIYGDQIGHACIICHK